MARLASTTTNTTTSTSSSYSSLLAGHVDIYNPIYKPTLPHRHRNIDPSLSTSNAHFRRLYDIYDVSLQRGLLDQAKKAYALLVRSKQFDWAANWRNGLEMVQLPLEEEEEGQGDEDDGFQGDDPDTTVTVRQERAKEREKRLIQLKVDYLRECHIIHSRKAKKSHSLREPEEILLQLVLLLATSNRHGEALNELEIYLPNSPYRDNALLHYYAGLLCIFSAQVEFSRDEALTAASNSSQNFIFSTGAFPSSSSLPQARGRVRPRSSSTSSSSSSSSSSRDSSSSDISSSDAPLTTSQRIQQEEAENNSNGKRRHGNNHYQYHTRKTGIAAPLSFYDAPTPEHVSKILNHSPSFASEARKWFDKAKEIVKEQEMVFDDLEDWVALLEGKKMMDTQAARRAARYRRTMDNHALLAKSLRHSQSQSLSQLSAATGLASQRSILKGKGRATGSSSQPSDLTVNSTARQGVDGPEGDDDDDEGEGDDIIMAWDLPPPLSSSSSIGPSSSSIPVARSRGGDAQQLPPSSSSSLPFPSSSGPMPPSIGTAPSKGKSKSKHKSKKENRQDRKRQKKREKTVTWAEVDHSSD